MSLNGRNALIGALSMVVLSACGGGDGLRFSEADQTAALEACAEQLGIPLFAQRLESRDGPDTIFAVNTNGVTLAQGRSINQCSGRTLRANYTPV